jgi:hypothetical protein
MTQEIQFPADIQHAIDRVLATFDAGAKVPHRASLAKVERWCEEHMHERQLFQHCEPFDGVDPTTYPLGFDDAALRDEQELADDSPISDDERLAYMDRQLRAILSGRMGDSDYMPTFVTIPIRDTGGRRAVLACSTSGYSFTEVRTTWYGIFLDADDFQDWLIGDGWILGVDEFNARAREERLELWDS